MRLSEIVRPDIRIARSVNLERDLGDPESLDRYLLTGKGLEIVGRLTAGLNGEKVSAWSLTGPYGMGKSAFVRFLLSLCGDFRAETTGTARQLLARKAPDLSERFLAVMKSRRADRVGFFQVAATAAFEPINRTLADALARAVQRAHEKSLPGVQFRELNAEASALRESADPDPARLAALFREAGRIARAPVAVVVDEFGKSLEYLARRPGRGDLFILQTLAESEGIFLWVCLHQAFEAYAAGLGRTQRQEWGKVQGRFEDVAFVEPRSQMRDFIGETLARPRPSDLADSTEEHGSGEAADRAVAAWADYFRTAAEALSADRVSGLGLIGSGGGSGAGSNPAPERAFPLHPLAAALLPELCTRFAQNDRTLFAFLCGGEPHALPAFLRAESLDPDGGPAPTFGPERLYDYFLGAAPALALSRPGASRWLEIHEMVEGARNLPDPQRNLLKIIGLLNLVSGPSGFRASRALLRFAVSRPGVEADAALESALAPLSEKGVLIYREYADEFRLWEGTDIDIPAAIERQKPAIAARPLAELLESAAPLSPVVASRHGYRTGTLRHFERRWCAAEAVAETVASLSAAPAGTPAAKGPGAADGLLLYVFGTEAPAEGFPARTADGRPVLTAFAMEEERLRERALDAAGAAAILTELPELARDGVARREARFRAGAAEERLRRFLDDLYTPGRSATAWRWGDEALDLDSPRALSEALSEVCDAVYNAAPVIRNELINRERLSAAAARARRELVTAMLTGESRENLGLTGTGPEVAIYRTLLKKAGIHGREADGTWRFSAPGADSTYRAAWAALDGMMGEAGGDPVPVPRMIETLRKPPFGMKDGPIPVLICLYLLVRSDEAALYQEGAFLPFLGPEDLELMVKRPEYFAIKRFSPLGLRGKVFQVYQDLLGAAGVSADRETRNAAMVNVVGPLVQFAGNLPPYVKQTRTVSREARAVLQRLLNARDPIDLLFSELPAAVGVDGFPADGAASDEMVERFQARLRDAITDLARAYGSLVERIGMVVREAFEASEEVGALRVGLAERAAALAARCGDDQLKPLVAALARNRGDDSEWLLSVATIASQRPVDSWRDRDLPAFSTRMLDLGRRFQAMERLVAEAERRLPEDREGKEARLISVARADGRMESRIFWSSPEKRRKMGEAVNRLRETHGDDELRELLVRLSEELLDDGGEEASS